MSKKWQLCLPVLLKTATLLKEAGRGQLKGNIANGKVEIARSGNDPFQKFSPNVFALRNTRYDWQKLCSYLLLCLGIQKSLSFSLKSLC